MTTLTSTLAYTIANNIRNRIENNSYYDGSSVFVVYKRFVFVNILSSEKNKRPIKYIENEYCFLQLIPYPLILTVHSDIFRYIRNPAAFNILKTKIDDLLLQCHF